MRKGFPALRKYSKRYGMSYRKRVADINRLYDRYVKLGMTNREIWRRYIYPVFAISERQFYNILNASADPRNEIPKEQEPFLRFEGDEDMFDDG